MEVLGADNGLRVAAVVDVVVPGTFGFALPTRLVASDFAFPSTADVAVARGALL